MKMSDLKKPVSNRGRGFALAPLGAAMLLATLNVQTAQAVTFELGEIDGSFDSSLSIGMSQRMSNRDQAYYSVGNGGTATSNTMDDGTLNFDNNDVFTKTFKGVHGLSLRYENVGVFVRGKYWYDFELNDGDQAHGNVVNSYTPGKLSDDGFHDLAQFSGAEILDAYVYGEFEVANTPLDLRLGRQVLSWGESTFIQGGINVINPVDVSAFRRPGAEIKEGLMPVNMLFASAGLTDNLSVEGFYQLEWEKTVVDGCGTLFSGADWAADGCDRLAFKGDTAGITDATNLAAGLFVNRSADQEPDDSGQFGVSSRYYADSIDTEFGAYYLNYHSRTPYVSAFRSTQGPHTGPGTTFDGTYTVAYPEDLELLGLSYQTSVGTWALSGEISYHPDLPLQINGNDLLGAFLTDGANPYSPVNSRVAASDVGALVNGYDEYDVYQIQTTAIQFFDRVLGASRLSLAAEIGATYVEGLPDAGDTVFHPTYGNLAANPRYGRATVFGSGAAGADGYTTKFAWGYRARASLAYKDVIAGINLTPSVAWSHDVEGNSPSPAQQFNEGSKAISLGLGADYMNRYTANVTYTDFFGGDYNYLTDKDNLSLSLGVSF
ncbi:MAG: hypothetical protein ACI9W6_001051 [Motiliproteus sp.]|jgi:hypothetical protein